jgi:hypothetical protein
MRTVTPGDGIQQPVARESARLASVRSLSVVVMASIASAPLSPAGAAALTDALAGPRDLYRCAGGWRSVRRGRWLVPVAIGAGSYASAPISQAAGVMIAIIMTVPLYRRELLAWLRDAPPPRRRAGRRPTGPAGVRPRNSRRSRGRRGRRRR